MRKQILIEADLPCVIMNRQDSCYSGVGFATLQVQLLVPEGFVEQAKSILQL